MISLMGKRELLLIRMGVVRGDGFPILIQKKERNHDICIYESILLYPFWVVLKTLVCHLSLQIFGKFSYNSSMFFNYHNKDIGG